MAGLARAAGITPIRTQTYTDNELRLWLHGETTTSNMNIFTENQKNTAFNPNNMRAATSEDVDVAVNDVASKFSEQIRYLQSQIDDLSNLIKEKEK